MNSHRDAEALLFRLFGSGLASTLRFITSGPGSGITLKTKLLQPGLSLAHLSNPVAWQGW
jgi:hypothetical protein